MEERTVDVGEVRLHVVIDGPERGRPVVLLHGFPEFWYAWRHQIAALARANFRVIAPDLRGYNTSDKPAGVSNYGLDHLARDVDGLLTALGVGRALVVGHDWGAAVAFHYAGRYPARVERLVVMNGPHARLMARALRRPAQLRKSWYMFFFQLPALPERMVLADSFLERSLRGTAASASAFLDEDLARYHEALHQPGAATAMINWYRAIVRRPVVSRDPIKCPTLVVWGDRDPFLGFDVMDGIERIAPDVRVHHVPEGSHWVQHDRPDEVNEQLLAFFAAE